MLQNVIQRATCVLIHNRQSFLDQAERFVLGGIYSVFVYRMGGSFLKTGNYMELIYLIDQLVILGFILARRPAQNITQRTRDWVVGFAGSFLSLAIAPLSIGNAILNTQVSLALILLGMCVHIAAKLNLGRSFGVVAADRGVKASGMYRLVRHPMYLGYMIVHSAFLLAGPNIYNVVVIGFCWMLLVWRIHIEEELLMDDPDYRRFAITTRYRLLPGIY